MTTLHLISKPAGHPAVSQALSVAQPGDALLFLGDGVTTLMAGSQGFQVLADLDREITLYGLAADIQARGLSTRLAERVVMADDDLFVTLTAQHARTLSWF
ncbi:sulfurtransferase complex subunit TusB [Parendozoicomonas haliclonae]|uniref:Protein TusB n=1 Tax=Parendozoicomonas haliclonae TaxID=1960125 RepID=A0A1X7AM54_9GAMM|nr:sulfurtransferase complex subunit TusB [Parendozoicomonas haliclonae]SMA48982.1 Protein TusB [Parendozoicomonas haliclonae]